MRFSPHPISFLTHDIVRQRYFELNGELRKFLTVVTTRARGQSHEMREYAVGRHCRGQGLTDYAGIITAVPRLRDA